MTYDTEFTALLGGGTLTSAQTAAIQNIKLLIQSDIRNQAQSEVFLVVQQQVFPIVAGQFLPALGVPAAPPAPAIPAAQNLIIHLNQAHAVVVSNGVTKDLEKKYWLMERNLTNCLLAIAAVLGVLVTCYAGVNYDAKKTAEHAIGEKFGNMVADGSLERIHQAAVDTATTQPLSRLSAVEQRAAKMSELAGITRNLTYQLRELTVWTLNKVPDVYYSNNNVKPMPPGSGYDARIKKTSDRVETLAALQSKAGNIEQDTK